MDRVRIAHIRDSGGIFGAERVILTLAKNLPGRFELILVCLRSPDGKSDLLKTRAEEIGVKVISVDVTGKMDFTSISNIRKMLKQQNIRIIHTHDFKSNLYGLLASINLDIHKVMTAGGTTRDSFVKNAYMYLDETVTYRYYDKIIAVSSEIRDRILRKGIHPGKVVTIENGIDPALYEYELDSGTQSNPLPVEKGKTAFAVIGRLYPDKGHMIFLEAFWNLLAERPDSIALFIGDGPFEGDIRKRIAELKIDGNVFLCGVRKGMSDVYRNINCLVIPSLTEGLPYVLLEALVYKVPVIATEVGGIPDLVKDGVTGRLVPPGNAKALEIAMKKFLSDPEKAREMVGNGYGLVIDRFSAKRMADRVGELYDLVAGVRNGRQPDLREV